MGGGAQTKSATSSRNFNAVRLLASALNNNIAAYAPSPTFVGNQPNAISLASGAPTLLFRFQGGMTAPIPVTFQKPTSITREIVQLETQLHHSTYLFLNHQMKHQAAMAKIEEIKQLQAESKGRLTPSHCAVEG